MRVLFSAQCNKKELFQDLNAITDKDKQADDNEDIAKQRAW